MTPDKTEVTVCSHCVVRDFPVFLLSHSSSSFSSASSSVFAS